MTDGPHRSLPLKRHWKHVAERASSDAWSLDDLADVLSSAVARDLKEAQLGAVKRIIGVRQDVLILTRNADTIVEELDRSRATSHGSVSTFAVIEGAIDAIQLGKTDEAAFEFALEYACNRICRNHVRSIEEHCRRGADAEFASHTRNRLNNARSLCDFGQIARRFAIGDIPNSWIPTLNRRTGLDDGPVLP